MPSGALAARHHSGLLAAFRDALVLPVGRATGEVLAILALCPLMLAAALWNGFPIIYYDTGAYLLEGLGRVFLPERSPVYSLFLDFGGARVSLWLIVLIQAALTSFTVVETTRLLVPRLTFAVLLTIGAVLVIATGLPWYVGQVEPDCFAAVAVLALYLLLFHASEVGQARRLALLLTAGLAIGAHTSHLLLGSVLVAAVGIRRIWPHFLAPLQRLLRHTAQARGIDQPRLLEPCLACLFGLSLVVASNVVLTGKVFVTRAGPAFLFARMLQDGLVMRLLDEECPQAHFQLCAYKEVLPRTADQWLWNERSPFFRMGRFEGTAAESRRIIFASLRRDPMRNMAAVAADTVRQFVTFRTGDQIESQEWVLIHPFSQLIPRQVSSYLAARQQREPIAFRAINDLDVPVAWLSLFGLAAGLGIAIRNGQRRVATCFGFILAALIVNAAICGALSNPHDRYQSRLIWLAPFALMLIAADRANFALRGVRESGT